MDPRITECWEAGLAVLKPSERELQHGLELHREAVVCDAYGFSPGVRVDVERLREAFDAGASAVELTDRSENLSMTSWVEDAGERQACVDAWEHAGVTCIFQNA